MSWLGRMIGYQKAAPTLAPGETQLGALTVQQIHTFNALLNTFSKTYSFRYDEAMRQDPDFALKMRRDVFIRGLLQERLLPLTRWKWSLVPEDPDHKEQADRAKWYEAVVKAQPHLSKKLLYLGHAAWYGRYGSQCAYVDDTVEGKPCKRIGRHRPVNGDKLVFDYESDDVGVRINSMVAGKYPKEDVTYDDRGGPILMLRQPEFRKKFLVHYHEIDDADYFEPEMAGRVKGIGLRDFAYYGAWLRSKLIQWAVNFMEKVGTLGLLVFWYPEGNAQAKAQAEEAAKQASNRSALAVPLPKGADKKAAGVDLLPANVTGVQFLVDIIAGWWEKHVERLFVGQSMSAGADNESGLGGTGRAEFAKDTKFNLLQFDATGLGESLTEDEIKPLCELNGDPGWKLRWEFALPDPEAEPKLNAITKAASLPGKKLEYKAAEVRALTGMSEPGPDDEVVGGADPMGPGIGPDGIPLPGAEILHGGGAGKPDATVPGGTVDGSTPAGQGPTVGPSTAPAPDAEPADDSEGADEPHPESEALTLAMLGAAEDGDELALDELAALAGDPDAMEGLLEDLGETEGEEPNTALSPSGVASYAWTAATTKKGKVKAVGSAEHTGKTLYGAKAEAALRAQGKRDNPQPTKKERAKAEAGERRKTKAAAVDTAKSAATKATTDPRSLSAGELGELAGHLKTLTVAQLKAFAKQVKGKVSGTKQALADRLLEYVRTGGGGAKPKTPEPTPEPAPTTAKIAGVDVPASELDVLAKRRAKLEGADSPPPTEPLPPEPKTPEEPVNAPEPTMTESERAAAQEDAMRRISKEPVGSPEYERAKRDYVNARNAGRPPVTPPTPPTPPAPPPREVTPAEQAALEAMDAAEVDTPEYEAAKQAYVNARRVAVVASHPPPAAPPSPPPEVPSPPTNAEIAAMEAMNAAEVGTPAYERAKADYLRARQAAKQAEKVETSAKELEEAIKRDKTDPAKTEAEANERANAILDKIKASHTPEEIHELAKRVTGKRGRAKDARDSLNLLRADLTAVARALQAQKV